MKIFFINLFIRIGYVLSFILIMAFIAAAMNDWLMGCGEGYHAADGWHPPDNKGCLFFSEN